MTRRKGRNLVLILAAPGIATIVWAGVALIGCLIEEYHLHQLLTGDESHKIRAAEVLGRMRSVRAVPGLIRYLSEGIAKNGSWQVMTESSTSEENTRTYEARDILNVVRSGPVRWKLPEDLELRSCWSPEDVLQFVRFAVNANSITCDFTVQLHRGQLVVTGTPAVQFAASDAIGVLRSARDALDRCDSGFLAARLALKRVGEPAVPFLQRIAGDFTTPGPIRGLAWASIRDIRAGSGDR